MKSNVQLNDLKVAAVVKQNSNRPLICQQCVVLLRTIKLAVKERYEGSRRMVDWQDVAGVITHHGFLGGIWRKLLAVWANGYKRSLPSIYSNHVEVILWWTESRDQAKCSRHGLKAHGRVYRLFVTPYNFLLFFLLHHFVFVVCF